MDLALKNLQWLMCHETKPNRGGRERQKEAGRETM